TRDSCSSFFSSGAQWHRPPPPLPSRGTQRPLCDATSVCLPRHPAVAYLFLVRCFNALRRKAGSGARTSRLYRYIAQQLCPAISPSALEAWREGTAATFTKLYGKLCSGWRFVWRRGLVHLLVTVTSGHVAVRRICCSTLGRSVFRPGHGRVLPLRCA